MLVRVLVNFKIVQQRWNSDRTLESSRRYLENHLKDIEIVDSIWNLCFGKHSVWLIVNCLLMYQPEQSFISVSYIWRHIIYLSNLSSHALSCSIYYSRWTQPWALHMKYMLQVRHGLVTVVSIWFNMHFWILLYDEIADVGLWQTLVYLVSVLYIFM